MENTQIPSFNNKDEKGMTYATKSAWPYSGNLWSDEVFFYGEYSSTWDSNLKIQILRSTLRCLIQRPTIAVLLTDRSKHIGVNEC